MFYAQTQGKVASQKQSDPGVITMMTGNRTEDREQRFGTLVELIYDSVQDLGKLASAMSMMCRELGAVSGHYVHLDVRSREVIASCVGSSDEQLGEPQDRGHYGRVDECLSWLATGVVGEWCGDHQAFDERFSRKGES